jgi:hypothetical protein
MEYSIYHETQNQVLQEIYTALRKSGYQVRELECLEIEHINYDTNRTYHFELKNKNGNLIKKFAHAFICRLSSGRYELTMHIS